MLCDQTRELSGHAVDTDDIANFEKLGNNSYDHAEQDDVELAERTRTHIDLHLT